MIREPKPNWTKGQVMVHIVERLREGEALDVIRLCQAYGLCRRTWRRYYNELVDLGLPLRQRPVRERHVVEWLGRQG